MSDKIVKVVALNVDTTQMDLYLDNGDIISIKQGDPRLKPILDTAKKQILISGSAEVIIPPKNTIYDEYSKKSGGLTKFFRIAKAKLKEIFNHEDSDSVVPQSVGLSKIDKALADIEKHAKPTIDEPENDEETIVAVTANGYVPDAQNLNKQMKWAMENNSITGVQNLISRLSLIIQERKHSVEDLLRFINRGDLPVAEDGSIIVYKVLKTIYNAPPNEFVDCHTGKVRQGVGSRVQMSIDLVDPNRSNECSNGLHIARRDYISQFYGNVCVIARIQPEDVIAVPHYDANKMRVCRYEILHQLSDQDYQTLKRKQSLEPKSEGMKALSKILKGHTVPIKQIVEIGGHRGTNVTYTKLDHKGHKIAQSAQTETYKASAIDIDSENSSTVTADLVDVKGLAKSVSEQKAASKQTPSIPKTEPRKTTTKKTKSSGKSKKEIIQEKFKQFSGSNNLTHQQKQQIAVDIISIKKKQKVGWERLGLTKEQGEQLTSSIK